METPVAPFPAVSEIPTRRRFRRRAAVDATPRAPRTEGLRAAFVHGLVYLRGAWRVLLAVLVVHLLIGMSVVMPLRARLAERLDSHAHGPSLSGAPDAYDARFEGAGWNEGGLAQSVFEDAMRLEKTLVDSQRITLYWLVLVAWLFGAVVSGGYLGTAVSGERPTVSGFLQQGAHHFWTMLRVSLVFGLIYYVAARVVLEAWALSAATDEQWAGSSVTAFVLDAARAGIMVVVFLWMRVACDLARADLVVFGRKSALAAVARALGRTVMHPVRTFGLALSCGVPALALIFGLSFAIWALPLDSWFGIVAAFVLVQLAVLLRLGSRAALLAGDVHLVRAPIRAAGGTR